MPLITLEDRVIAGLSKADDDYRSHRGRILPPMTVHPQNLAPSRAHPDQPVYRSLGVDLHGGEAKAPEQLKPGTRHVHTYRFVRGKRVRIGPGAKRFGRI